MRESKVEKYLKKQIEALGGWCIKFPPLFFRGFPDRIILVGGGQVVFVETKAPDKKPTLIQRKVHDGLRGLGFRVEVIDTLEDVDLFILTL